MSVENLLSLSDKGKLYTRKLQVITHQCKKQNKKTEKQQHPRLYIKRKVQMTNNYLNSEMEINENDVICHLSAWQ